MESLERIISNLVKALGIKENIQVEILATDDKQKKGKGNKDKEIKKELPVKKIKKIKHVLVIDDLTNEKVLSMAKIQDKRIAVGCEDGSISICSCNLKQKDWERDIYEEEAHVTVQTLCSLNDNRLLSSDSYPDCLIKVWKVYPKELKILKILKNHTNLIFKIIPLNNQRFASCSKDCTVKIWEDKNYNMLSSLTHKIGVLSILQLKEKTY